MTIYVSLKERISQQINLLLPKVRKLSEDYRLFTRRNMMNFALQQH